MLLSVYYVLSTIYVLYIHYLVNFYRSECTDEEAEQSYVKCRVMQLI